MTTWACLECGAANPTANVICGSHACQLRRLRDLDAGPQVDPQMSATPPATEPQISANGSATPATLDVAGVSKDLDLDPNPTPKKQHSYTTDFELWWKVFPLRKDKFAASVAYRKARKSASAEVLREGALRYRNDPQRKPEFTKYPATWLNAGGWLDEDGADIPDAHRIRETDWEAMRAEEDARIERWRAEAEA